MATMTKPETTVPITFDPLTVLQAVHPAALGTRGEPSLHKHLRELRSDERSLLGGLAVHVIHRHLQPGDPLQQIGYLTARVTETLQATHIPTKVGGHGHFLEAYFETDDQRRRVWRSLGLTLQALGPDVASSLVAGLIAAGDLRATLRARRDEIDRVLAVLDELPKESAA